MAKKKKSDPTREIDVPVTIAAPQQPAQKPPDPKFMWPPFPTPPPGVTIIPFSQFEPKGIKVSLDDEPEVDGEGVRTITLMVKHTLSGHRKSRNNKKKDPLAEISEEELRKMTWDKRWELGEELRSAKPLEDYEPLVERFIESTRLFHTGRPWDKARQELWDQFRLYTGIISGVKKPRYKSKMEMEDNEVSGGPASDPEDDISDEDPMVVTADPLVTSDQESGKLGADEGKMSARNEEIYQKLLAAREERPYFWVQETEKAIKVFLSSHFQDRGLMWSKPNCRDMPIMLRFYLEFVLHNKLFVEKDVNRRYERALVVAKRAEEDLVATFTMTDALQDPWGLACKSFWGQLHRTPAWEDAKPPSSQGHSEVSDEVNQPKLVTVNYEFGKKSVKEEAARTPPLLEKTIREEATFEEVDGGPPTAAMVEECAHPMTNGDIVENEDAQQKVDDLWGPYSHRPPSKDLASEWSLPKEEEEDPWGPFVEPTLFEFIGPSEFPTRRIPIRVEMSTRVLVGILPPDPASTSIVASRLATLVLQPWPNPSNDDDSLVKPPQMLDFWKGDQEKRDLRAASLKLARGFDPTEDEIRVFVEPKAADKCRLGMGIIATWVQVGRRADLEPTSKPTKRKKHSGDDWWYIERLEHVIPSYWTPNDPHRDMTRIENNPVYAYDNDDDGI